MRLRPLGKTGLRVDRAGARHLGALGRRLRPRRRGRAGAVLERALEMGFSAHRHGRRLRRRPHGAASSAALLADRTRRRRRHQGRHRPHHLAAAQALRRAVHPRVASSARCGASRRERVDVYLLHNPSVARARGRRGGRHAHRAQGRGQDRPLGRQRRRRRERAARRSAAAPRSSSSPTTCSTRSDLHRLAGEIIVAGAGVARALDAGVRPARRRAGRRTASSPTGDHRADRWTKPELARRVQQLAVAALPRPRRRADDARGGRPLRAGQPHRVDAPCSARAA